MIIKQFIGHSGAVVNLVENELGTVVEKTGVGIERNYNRITSLRSIVDQPEILAYDGNTLTMEYIQNTDVKNYLIDGEYKKLIRFIKSVYDRFSSFPTGVCDYTSVYERRLSSASWLPTSIDNLMDELPRHLPKTVYHGDLTCNNILYDYNRSRFVLIDAVDIDLDNVHFDISKLRQDIDCGWFIRDSHILLSNRLLSIQQSLSEHCEHYNNNAMAILCLLRIWPYSSQQDRTWLAEQMEILWKNK